MSPIICFEDNFIICLQFHQHLLNVHVKEDGIGRYEKWHCGACTKRKSLTHFLTRCNPVNSAEKYFVGWKVLAEKHPVEWKAPCWPVSAFHTVFQLYHHYSQWSSKWCLKSCEVHVHGLQHLRLWWWLLHICHDYPAVWFIHQMSPWLGIQTSSYAW